MSRHELDPDIYREIWGEYPPQTPSSHTPLGDNAVASKPPLAEVVNEARVVRETLLAAIEPHLIALQARLSAIESRLEGVERELKEVGNRGT